MEVYHININKEDLDINAFVAANSAEMAMLIFGKEALNFGILFALLDIEDADFQVKLFDGLHYDTEVAKTIYANIR